MHVGFEIRQHPDVQRNMVMPMHSATSWASHANTEWLHTAAAASRRLGSLREPAQSSGKVCKTDYSWATGGWQYIFDFVYEGRDRSVLHPSNLQQILIFEGALRQVKPMDRGREGEGVQVRAAVGVG